jgi:hypothetical protein
VEAVKIIIYSFDRDEMDLYAHYAETQLGVWVTKCYDHFTLQRELAGGSCVVIIRTSVKSNAAGATASLIAGWLDHSTEHRLIIHDWPAHCDDSVDARVFRMGEPYADGTPARGKKVGEKEKQSIAARITPKPTPRPEPEPARKIAGNDFTPSEVAMAIIQDAQAGGPRVLMALTDIAKSVMASGLTAEAARDKMLGRWNEYKQAAMQMKWTYSGIEKFFAGGMWDKPEAWPWQEKERAQPGYKSATTEVQMSEEEIQAFHARQAEIFKNSPLARLRGSL